MQFSTDKGTSDNSIKHTLLVLVVKAFSPERSKFICMNYHFCLQAYFLLKLCKIFTFH